MEWGTNTVSETGVLGVTDGGIVQETNFIVDNCSFCGIVRIQMPIVLAITPN
jgi:hypothetical protein